MNKHMKKITYFDEETRTWKERFDKEEPGYRVAEVGHPTYEQLRAVGAISGSRSKDRDYKRNNDT